jgi:hypothetical protein
VKKERKRGVKEFENPEYIILNQAIRWFKKKKIGFGPVEVL